MNDEQEGHAAGNSAENSGQFKPGNPYQFQPGQSGNPSGRPKKKWLTELHEELLEEKLSDPVERAKFKEAQWQTLLSNKVVGAMKLDKLWERTEGKVVQPVEHSGNITLGQMMAEGEERLKKRE